mmetsp:Transcript_30476/g.76510  ORF Transcript_30476/g.76510 Transcript_30476/m.76510 type:complete len:109 (+) Transcript_30476:50-376(+)
MLAATCRSRAAASRSLHAALRGACNEASSTVPLKVPLPGVNPTRERRLRSQPSADAARRMQAERDRVIGLSQAEVGHVNPATGEVGGPRGAEPTRFGDWERNGRCSDF